MELHKIKALRELKAIYGYELAQTLAANPKFSEEDDEGMLRILSSMKLSDDIFDAVKTHVALFDDTQEYAIAMSVLASQIAALYKCLEFGDSREDADTALAVAYNVIERFKNESDPES